MSEAARSPAESDEPWRKAGAEPFIRIENVTKRFGDFAAVNNVSLDIYRGEMFSLLGGSGCGKTTLLRLLAGFERLDQGRIVIDGADMADVPPYRRPVNMMFQSYALFPHMTVAGNIAFGLRQDRLSRAAVRDRVEEMLALVQLTAFAKRKPHQLSGGQRQRVALARSLAKRPKVLLLDEPLGALDRKLREHTQFELIRIQEQVGITFIVVTHDQEEAMTLSTRIGVMEKGEIVQTGTPSEIYEYPANRFVADFIGSVNMFEGRIVEDAADHVVIDALDADCRFHIDHGISGPTDARCWVALRPEKITLAKTPPEDTRRNCLRGRIDEIAYLGSASIFQVALDGDRMVRVTRPNLQRREQAELTWDDEVWLSWQPESPVVLLN